MKSENAELVGADIGKAAGEQPAGKTAEQRADRKGRDLGAEHVDAVDAGRELIVAHRAHGAAELGIRQMPDDVADDGEHRDAEGEIALRARKQLGTADIGNAVGPMGEPDRIDHHQRDDLLERDRHHGEVMPAEPQRRHAEEGAGNERHEATCDQAQPVAHMQVGGADCHDIGAEAEKRGLCQIDLAAQAEHDRKPEHGDRECRRLHQDVEDVAVELHAGCERNQDGSRDEIRQVPQQHRFGTVDSGRDRHVVASRAHAFSATRSPKMPCGRKIRNATSTKKAKPSL